MIIFRSLRVGRFLVPKSGVTQTAAHIQCQDLRSRAPTALGGTTLSVALAAVRIG